jgi:hypothetical protein
LIGVFGDAAAAPAAHDRRVIRSTFLLVACCLWLAACAPMVPSSPALLENSPAAASAPAQIVLERDVDLRLSTGYSRTLPAASVWRRVGRLPQGDVYRPIGIAFALEGRQVHEAYLVVSGSILRGFYLPAESAYSPLVSEIPLPLKATP